MPRGMSFLKALEQGLKLVDMAPAFPFPCFDLAVARLPRDSRESRAARLVA